ncbi:GNAT family N-acetyltransferase [Clostridium fungisolvens]|nr:GNAT family N-acetyltransferase [Clostridium fungisolvens]
MMNNVIKRPYRRLADFMKVYQFMIDNYSVDWKNGAPATFFEYAQMLFWTDNSQSHRNAIWEDKGEIVGFCFYESQIGKAFFNLKEGYEKLIPEMIEHAEQRLSNDGGSLELSLFMSQKNVIEVAKNMGYEKTNEWKYGIYDFSKGPLNYQLPEGFFFEEPGKQDMKKKIEAFWRGFDHDTEPEGGVERGYNLMSAPYATPELDVVIKNSRGEYVCCAGMWMVPENNLAYLEPLATVPEYRKMGLASAALSELYRRTVALGATHMTGGGNGFYFAISFEPLVKWSSWKKI